jgi:hypothetical protein
MSDGKAFLPDLAVSSALPESPVESDLSIFSLARLSGISGWG